jgi:chemotaxis protein MotB
MAMSRRRSERGGVNIWPGFVDALTQLVMVIIFVLLMFTAGQFYLTDALSGRDAELRKLTDQVNQLSDILALQKSENATLTLNVTQLTSDLAAMTAARDALATQSAALAAKADEAAKQLAASQAQLAQNQQDLAAARDRGNALEGRLATAETGAALAQQQIAKSDVRAAQAESSVTDLTTQLAVLQQELARIAAALDASEVKNKDQQVQLADLGKRLNQALASKVEELARYRSEFFGRLRDVLGDRADIRVVGDRFVFQSEVLFAPGSATLSPEARARLKPVADAIRQIAPKIPTDLPWVLEVAGHTDKQPINTAEFPSNWELSTARALSVVRYLAEQHIPPSRLAAAGYGAYDPIDPRDTPDAYRKNRRIELKLTEP